MDFLKVSEQGVRSVCVLILWLFESCVLFDVDASVGEMKVESVGIVVRKKEKSGRRSRLPFYTGIWS
jgi:hypothetical protein